jgi:protein transport protein YIF1
MQRQGYTVPAKSPELFMPQPQRTSQVPHLRSPPPPVQQQPSQFNSYGNPNPSYQSSPPQGNMASNNQANGFSQFNTYFNDPAAQMGIQVGQHAMKAGQDYIEGNLNRYISVPALKHYFNVSNSYVVRKLLLVLFPWRHKPWTRQQARMTTSSTDASGQISQQQYTFNYLPPRDDLNSPDMYIPIMAFITYILLSTVLAGMRGSFHPELLGSTTSTALGVVIFEIVVLKIAMYLLSITNDSQLLDLVAYSGYKFVGVIATLFLAEIMTGGQGTNNWVGWVFFLYTWYANAFFLVSCLLVATYLISILMNCSSEVSNTCCSQMHHPKISFVGNTPSTASRRTDGRTSWLSTLLSSRCSLCGFSARKKAWVFEQRRVS